MNEQSENQACRIELGGGAFLKIETVEIVGDICDADGRRLGTGNHAVTLRGDELERLPQPAIQAIADICNNAIAATEKE